MHHDGDGEVLAYLEGLLDEKSNALNGILFPSAPLMTSCVVPPMTSSFNSLGAGLHSSEIPPLGRSQSPSSATRFEADADGAERGPNSKCWGSQLPGGFASCSSSFLGGKRHFKNKFCFQCRQGLFVPVEYVRALTPALRDAVHNRPSEGFWNEMNGAPFDGLVRIINNTAGCSGPWLVVYKEKHPPSHVEWGEIPSTWVDEHGIVALIVAKGTLVPLKELTSWRPPKSGVLSLEGSPPQLVPSAKRVPAPSRKRARDGHPALLSEENEQYAGSERATGSEPSGDDMSAD